MLAYLFWHRPAAGVALEGYERDQRRLHRSLAARPPEGFRGSACLRAPGVSWLGPAADAYEDWYLVDDWAALGVLRAAAVAAGHEGAHAAAARHAGAGAGGVYRLAEGAVSLADVRLAVWITPTRERPEDGGAGLLLGDGLDRARCGLWRRELVLGPAPEYCVLGDAEPAGVASARLPAGWRAAHVAREPIGEAAP